MNNQINNILQDLYNIDPTLKSMESELIKIINELLVSQPETKFDDNFRLELRTKLLQKAEELLARRSFNKGGKTKKITYNFMNFKKLFYTFGAVVVIILLIVPTMYYYNNFNKTNISVSNNIVSNLGLKIAKLDNNAFGILSSTESLEQPQTSGLASGLGGGGGIARTESSSVGYDLAMDIPAPMMNSYNFIYKGEELETLPTKLAVLKRQKQGFTDSGFSNLIKNFGSGLIDLSKFGNSQITNLSFSQKSDYGYSFYVDFNEGLISISENWETWPQCYDQKCFENRRLTINDVPTDEQLIKLADEFIKKFNINITNYGQPQINKQWLIGYEQFTNKAEYSAPEIITVTYPLVIDGKTIYEESGNPHGLSININIRLNKVSGAYNITSQNYQSSDYDIETNSEEIIKLAEKGGLNNMYSYSNSAKIIELNLGTPTLAYVKIWNYSEERSEEIIIPAYIFPILNYDENIGFWQKQIIVPLVKDLIKNRFPEPRLYLEQVQ